MKNKASNNITFHYLCQDFKFQHRQACKEFIGNLFRREKKSLDSLTYIFCTDEYLLTINRDFLQHDYYTDIITFELAEPGAPTQGEIYISIDRVKENARDHQESFARELHRVIFHGALHLCGFPDKTEKEAAKMRQKEEEYLARYFTPTP